jgi:predicted glutamine amidotransferase
MCRFIFLYKCNDTQKQLFEFLHKQFVRHDAVESGYGATWYDSKTWNSYKSTTVFSKDQNFAEVVKNLSDILIFHIRYIVHMPTLKYNKEHVVENSHPFFYKDSTFVHHGDLFYKPMHEHLLRYQDKRQNPEFKKIIKKLKTHISPHFLKEIKGHTDSELMFYLALTAGEDLEKIEGLSKPKIFLYSFIKMLEIVNYYSIENISNFFFANKDYIIIANILKKTPTNERNKLDLYIHKERNGGVIMSSVKVIGVSKEIGANEIYFIHIASGTKHHYKVPNLVTFYGGGPL